MFSGLVLARSMFVLYRYIVYVWWSPFFHLITLHCGKAICSQSLYSCFLSILVLYCEKKHKAVNDLTIYFKTFKGLVRTYLSFTNLTLVTFNLCWFLPCFQTKCFLRLFTCIEYTPRNKIKIMFCKVLVFF